jgi:hypothetical protein
VAIDKGRVLENLAIASAIGFLALLLATMTLVVDSRETAEERAYLSIFGDDLRLVSRVDDPDFDRIFSIQGPSGPSYGAVLSLRSREGGALIGAAFTPQGELRKLSLLGSCMPRLPEAEDELIMAFEGGSEALARIAEYVRGAGKAGAEAGS